MIKIDKILRDKKNNSVIYILIATGILLMIFGGSFKSTPEKTATNNDFSVSERAEGILSEIDGVGRVSVMISEKKDENEDIFSSGTKGETEGGHSVLIVADGGADSRVKEKIIKAASAALGVGPHKIVVFERKE